MYKWEPYMQEYNDELGEHPLCERLATDTEHFIISVNCYESENVEPYFKVKKYNDKSELVGLCRISFFKPSYITGYDENMILNQYEISEIMSEFVKIRGSFIENICRVDGNRNYWTWLISEANDIMYECYGIKPIADNIPIPNYNLLLRKEA